jgi:hypothetical protein
MNRSSFAALVFCWTQSLMAMTGGCGGSDDSSATGAATSGGAAGMGTGGGQLAGSSGSMQTGGEGGSSGGIGQGGSSIGDRDASAGSTGGAGGSGGGPGSGGHAGSTGANDAAPDAPPIRVVGNGETTLTVLAAQGPNCVSCAMQNGCLDPAQSGGSCEDTPGTAPAACAPVFGMTTAPSETKVCLATLKMIFSSHCSTDLQQEPCFCGQTDRTMCLAGNAAPSGPGVDLYTCDLGAGGIASIVNDFGNQMRGAGQANEIVDCVGALGCDCNL